MATSKKPTVPAKATPAKKTAPAKKPTAPAKAKEKAPKAKTPAAVPAKAKEKAPKTKTPAATPAKAKEKAPKAKTPAATPAKAKEKAPKTKTPAATPAKAKEKAPKTKTPATPAKAKEKAPKAKTPAATSAKAKEKAPKTKEPKSTPAKEKTPKSKETKQKETKQKADAMTPEEKKRLAKFKATCALLKADPEWPAFLAAQKELLLHQRDQLLPNMQSVTRDHLRSGASNVSSASGQHIGDAGSEAEVRDLTIRLLDKDREQLFEIDAALERIRRGTYGICEISLDPIPKKRLQVRPACRLTVKCQEEYEKKYGSYAKFRAQNSDNVGFSGLQNVMESVISLDEMEE